MHLWKQVGLVRAGTTECSHSGTVGRRRCQSRGEALMPRRRRKPEPSYYPWREREDETATSAQRKERERLEDISLSLLPRVRREHIVANKPEREPLIVPGSIARRLADTGGTLSLPGSLEIGKQVSYQVQVESRRPALLSKHRLGVCGPWKSRKGASFLKGYHRRRRRRRRCQWSLPSGHKKPKASPLPLLPRRQP